jgi:CheY-like chemotaxis protein
MIISLPDFGAALIAIFRPRWYVACLIIFRMRTALIIEDDEFAMKVFTAVLRRCGFHIVRAANGLRGLEICRKIRGALDLIICDVMLPGDSGPATMMEATEVVPETPILFTSGTPVQGWTQRDVEYLHALRSKIKCDFLAKPFHASRLVEAVQALLGRSDRPSRPTGGPIQGRFGELAA